MKLRTRLYDWLRLSAPSWHRSQKRRTRIKSESLEPRTLLTTFLVSNLNDSGPGSFRQAVIDANAAVGADIIDATGILGTITLTSGELGLTESVTINGPGADKLVISGNSLSRVFNVGGSGLNQFNINDLTVSDGIAPGSEGGGIRFEDADDTMDLRRLSIRNNSANGGGGVYIEGADALAEILDCTIYDNESTFAGAAVSVLNSRVWITNSTISGNTSVNGFAAIDHLAAAGFSQLTVRNITVAETTGKGISNAAMNGGTANLFITNSILAANSMINADNQSFGGTATLDSGGHNVSDDETEFFTAVEDQQSTDPLLGPLAYNGGSTPTHALLFGSPAIDRGNNAYAVDSFGNALKTDQRGAPFSRIYNGDQIGTNTVDVGAFESYETLVVDNLTDVVDDNNGVGEFTLRDAIAVANAQPGPDVIHIPLTGTLDLLEGELSLTDSLTISGPGAQQLIVSGKNSTRIFRVGGDGQNSFALTDFTIAEGNAGSSEGGGVRFDDPDDSLDIRRMVIRNNFANGGGGIYASGSDAALQILDSSLFDNGVAYSGSALLAYNTNAWVTNSTISRNSSDRDYGAIVNQSEYGFQSTVILKNVTVADNTGAGAENVAQFGGNAAIEVGNSVFANNSAGNLTSININSTLVSTSTGHNISDDLSNIFTHVSDRPQTNPLIGSLANNGGPTPTHALLSGSPAVNHGDNSQAVDAFSAALVSDQRGPGFSRIQFGAVDAGAFELQQPVGTNGNDQFFVTYPDNGSGLVNISMSADNGPIVSLGVFSVSLYMVLDGLGGNDSIKIFGTPGDDVFRADSSGLNINGASLTLVSIEEKTLAGLAGNDVYQFNSDTPLGFFALDESGGGIDTLDLSSTTSQNVVVNLSVSDVRVVNSHLSIKLGSGLQFENLTGGSGNDTLTGNSLANTITGNGGNDTISGGLGSDILVGGLGNDTYRFGGNSSGGELDVVTEAAGEGTDTLDFSSRADSVYMNLGDSILQQGVHAGRSVKLSSSTGIENLIGGSGNDVLTGNSLNNEITGNVGHDTLNGGAGSDVLIGGSGNDSYLFDAVTSGTENDVVTEASGQGVDTLDFFPLTVGVTINIGDATNNQSVHTGRRIKLSSSTGIDNVIGGSGNDTLTGNSLANMLAGDLGNDTLNGGSGSDHLVGGFGDDTYVFGSETSGTENDVITESPGQGIDTVNFSALTSSVTINISDSSNNQSAHTGRRIKLSSGLGIDNVIGGSGNDRLTGNSLANTITGNGGHDTISGGLGSDILVGGLGNDTYRFGGNSSGGELDVVMEATGEGTDTLDFSSRTDSLTVSLADSTTQQAVHAGRSLKLSSSTAIEHLIGGSGDDLLTGNSLANTLVGNAGNNTLIGLAGDDFLIGGVGDDLYVFDADTALGTDTISEGANSGTDTIDFSQTSTGVSLNLSLVTTQTVNVNHNLFMNVFSTIENLVGGSGNDTLTGSFLANTLTGNAGNDTLNGEAGSDQLVGGFGDDTYVFGAVTSETEDDVITESSGQGIDTLNFSALTSSVTINISDSSNNQTVHSGRRIKLSSGLGIDNVIGGSGSDTLTGNSLANTITGNGGNDTISGGPGSDVLIGGLGNDTYRFGNATEGGELDRITEASNEGTDTLDFSSRTVGVTINISDSVNRQQVELDRQIKLSSGLGIDNIIGGRGNDVLTGNSLTNTITGNAGHDVLNGGLGSDFLIGGAGSDVYVFGGATSTGELDTVTEASSVDQDTLDFSNLSLAINVNISDSQTQQQVHTNRKLKLSSGLGLEIVLGGRGDDNIIGNSIANVLVGNSGNDVLTGNSGRDILIGGRGTNLLLGGNDDDILIGGSTVHDTSPVDLGKLLIGWTSNSNYATRVASLRSGVGSPAVSLKRRENVFDDSGVGNMMEGGTGSDWYFRTLDDLMSGLADGELTDLLNS
jgi:Ca2+-binding RTX toxin-like protein